MNRRTFLAGGVAAALGCGRADRNRELRVFVYAGGHEAAMKAEFVPRFEAANGVPVRLFPGWWDGVPKVKAAPADDPPFDLMITDATQGDPAARDGLFRTINWANVPNVAAVAHAALTPWVYWANLGLPYPDAVMTLAFTAGSTPPPTRWADLIDDRFAGRLGLYDQYYMSLFTFAAALADSTGRPGTAHELIRTQMDEVFRFAVAHRHRVKRWWPTSTDMILALAEDAVAVGNMHSPEYLQAMREKPHLRAVVPPTDRAMVRVFWAIPAGTRQANLAEEALNVLFSYDVQLGFARRGMATPRPDAAAAMAAADPLWASLYPHTAEQFGGLKYYPYDVYAENADALADRWDRTVVRRS